MNVDNVGVTLIFDGATDFVIGYTKKNVIAHFVCSCVLDTASHVFMNTKDRILDYNRLVEHGKLLVVRGIVKQAETERPPEVIEKQKLVSLLIDGATFLFGQAEIIFSSFDGFDFLSTSDLPMYQLNKKLYWQAYADSAGCSLTVAEKHCEFLAQNLLNVTLRKKALIQKFGPGLRAVKNQEDYDLWHRELFNEVIGLGCV